MPSLLQVSIFRRGSPQRAEDQCKHLQLNYLKLLDPVAQLIPPSFREFSEVIYLTIQMPRRDTFVLKYHR
jgi:hypothetical protein